MGIWLECTVTLECHDERVERGAREISGQKSRNKIESNTGRSWGMGKNACFGACSGKPLGSLAGKK